MPKQADILGQTKKDYERQVTKVKTGNTTKPQKEAQ
jgi:hypothetical protein